MALTNIQYRLASLRVYAFHYPSASVLTVFGTLLQTSTKVCMLSRTEALLHYCLLVVYSQPVNGTDGQYALPMQLQRPIIGEEHLTSQLCAYKIAGFTPPPPTDLKLYRFQLAQARCMHASFSFSECVK